MEAIERENDKMEGVLPKEVYSQLVPEEEPELLSKSYVSLWISLKISALICSVKFMSIS